MRAHAAAWNRMDSAANLHTCQLTVATAAAQSHPPGPGMQAAPSSTTKIMLVLPTLEGLYSYPG
jgi:hypothetical protein